MASVASRLTLTLTNGSSEIPYLTGTFSFRISPTVDLNLSSRPPGWYS